MNIWYNILPALSALLWAINAISIKILADAISPYTFVFLQYASLILLLFVVKRPQMEWKWLLGISCGWYLFNHLFLALSFESGMPAGFGIFLHKTCALFAWIFAYIFFHETPKKHQYLGIIISLIGLFQLIALHFHESISNLSIFYIFLSAAFWGLGAACQKKNVTSSSLSVVVWGAGLSSFPMLLILLCMGKWDALIQDLNHFDLRTALCLLFTIVFGLIVAGVCWLYTVKKEGISKVAPYVLLSPPLTYILSVAFLNEHVTLELIIAFSTIIIGLAIMQFGQHFFFSKKQAI